MWCAAAAAAAPTPSIPVSTTPRSWSPCKHCLLTRRPSRPADASVTATTATGSWSSPPPPGGPEVDDQCG